MEIQTLITMANQIGDFYKSYPNESLAQQELATHINRFWALAMRKRIAEYVNQGGEGLHPPVLAAIKAHLQL